MSTAIEIVIKRRIPSGNKSTFGNRWSYMKERDIWSTLIRAKLVPKAKPDHRVKVHCTSYRTSLCDRINLAHGFKSCLDALVKLGYLHDDNEKWLDDTYQQIKSPRAFECTVIQILNP